MGLGHLLRLHTAGRLTPAFLSLALRTVQGVDDFDRLVRPPAEAAAIRARRNGYRELQGCTGSPWICSRLGRLH